MKNEDKQKLLEKLKQDKEIITKVLEDYNKKYQPLPKKILGSKRKK